MNTIYFVVLSSFISTNNPSYHSEDDFPEGGRKPQIEDSLVEDSPTTDGAQSLPLVEDLVPLF